ncbi:MAG TPA: DUF6056 family protein [Kofleriaceae bacterium]|jgi:hypothetical protein|nr:DUF6056 family protein [Kofleriaceae bacterium]
MAARDRLVFAAGVIGLWGFFVVMAVLTPTQLDDWYEVAWHHHHGFTLAGVLEFARYNYFNYNPRPGETFLLLVNGPRIVHVLITPIFELALLFVVHLLARGRWPRADRTTLAELAIAQVLIWLVIPIPGPMYFYRPYTTNYLFASCVQLGLFVPFRIELARPAGPPRWWLAPVLLAWGIAGGMTNEHTGPAAIVVAFGVAGLAWRRRRLRGWMVTAAVGLVVGYLLLYFAPGQTKRYAGLATDISPLKTIRDHGLYGCLRIVGSVVTEAQIGLAAVTALVLIALRRARTAGRTLAGLDGETIAAMVVALGFAAMIAVTIFASPIIEDRVLFASCLLVTVILVAATTIAWQEPRTRRLMIGIAGGMLAFYAVGFVVVYRQLAAESADRIAALDRAGPDDVVEVEPTAFPHRDLWSYGEDLQYAYMREFVAHRVFGVRGLELVPRPVGAQPNPPERPEVAVVFEPPIDARAARPGWPLWQAIPTQWPWVVREIRETLAELDAVPGHRLHEIDVTAVPATPGMPAGKPVYLVRWIDGAFTRIDARTRADDRGWPFLVFAASDLPRPPTEAWLSACGETRPVELQHTGDELRIPIVYQCSGNHTIYVCDAEACWLAGRYW